MQRRIAIAAIGIIAVLSVFGALYLWRQDSTATRHPQRVTVARCGLSQARGDFDGDGRKDVAIVYAALPRRARCDLDHVAGRFVLRVKLASGSTHDLSLVNLHTRAEKPCLEFCLILAAPDLAGDGRNELAVELGAGASEVWFSLFDVGSGGIEQMLMEWSNGSQVVRVPAEFRLFGSLGHGAGFACRTAPSGAPLVVESGWGVTDAKHAVVGQTVYVVHGRRLRRVSTVEHRLRISSEQYPPAAVGRQCLKPNEHLVGLDPRRS